MNHCKYCPVKKYNVEAKCITETTRHFRYCEFMDPNNPDYNPQYEEIILKKSGIELDPRTRIGILSDNTDHYLWKLLLEYLGPNYLMEYHVPDRTYDLLLCMDYKDSAQYRTKKSVIISKDFTKASVDYISDYEQHDGLVALSAGASHSFPVEAHNKVNVIPLPVDLSEMYIDVQRHVLRERMAIPVEACLILAEFDSPEDPKLKIFAEAINILNTKTPHEPIYGLILIKNTYYKFFKKLEAVSDCQFSKGSLINAIDVCVNLRIPEVSSLCLYSHFGRKTVISVLADLYENDHYIRTLPESCDSATLANIIIEEGLNSKLLERISAAYNFVMEYFSIPQFVSSWSIYMNNVINLDLKDIPKEVIEQPGFFQRAWTFGKALARHAKNKFATVPSEVAKARLQICESCDQFEPKDRTCKACTCYLDIKTKWSSESCPLEKWHMYTGETRTAAPSGGGGGCGCGK
jgi:hypothetical protein